MHLKEVIIDGFKSYATRTVITGFDRSFNAITGLNGSGKSNIFDSIMFVLGITNLKQVRARSLQDLVYKQGQAGIKKASVTLVFDNADHSTSPVGYEAFREITVTRQVVIGGHNKFLINGRTATTGKVGNLFQSCGLNVNNATFLIAQGRITKVINMNPHEIKGLLEEAAGTRMYETKKAQALRTLEKKKERETELSKLLTEAITPTLERLRTEREVYHQWSSGNTEVERLSRYVVAYQFVKASAARDTADTDGSSLVEALEAAVAEAETSEEASAEFGARVEELSARVREELEGSVKELAKREEELSKVVVKHTSAWTNGKSRLEEEEDNAAGLAKTVQDAIKAVKTMERKVEKQHKHTDSASKDASAAKALVAELQAKVTSVAAGMAVDGEEGSTENGQRMEAERQMEDFKARAKQHRMRAEHLDAAARDASDRAAKAEKEVTGLKADVKRADKEVTKLRTSLDKLGFDEGAEPALRSRRERVAADLSKVDEDLETRHAALAGRLSFDYDKRAMGRGWDSSRVKGVVAKLIRVKDASTATALEVAAGGKLYQVVVDNDETSTALITKGRLKRRVTIIPLNKISARTLRPEQKARIAEVGGDSAAPAISLVGYDDEVAKAMSYVFGTTLVCKDSETAKALTFDPKVKTVCVTTAGDSYDPAGTLEGGSRPQAGSLLVQLQAISELEAQRGVLRDTLAGIDAEIEAVTALAARAESLISKLELAMHQRDLAQKRIDSSEYGSLRHRADQSREAAIKEEALAEEAESSSKAAAVRVAELQAAIASASARREAAVAEIESALAKAKSDEAKAATAATAAVSLTDELRIELDAANDEVKSAQEALDAAQSVIEELREEVSGLEATAKEASDAYETARSEAESHRTELTKATSDLRSLQKRQKTANAAATAARHEQKRCEARLSRHKRDVADAEAAVASLLEEHPWIETEKQFFGKAHTDYDFEARNPAEASSRLKELKAKQAALAKKINKKVIGMIETAEREYQDLMNKRKIVANDREKIEAVITELDDKKDSALRATWKKVDKDFASIFSTLLPGAMSRLQPPEGGTVLDGLTIGVAFGGVWKASLSELSGGQRSLLALSLILALLRFKPAPMYILDEVDAALDLSHTQNIGAMLAKHFSSSQFLVVSLKPGMFNNANVVFRTKFVDGVSTVTRTTPARPALAARGGGGGGGGGGRSTADEENTSGAPSSKASRTSRGSRRRAVA